MAGRLSLRALASVLGGVVAFNSVSAQSERGGFIARLGNDTVHIERFERSLQDAGLHECTQPRAQRGPGVLAQLRGDA